MKTYHRQCFGFFGPRARAHGLYVYVFPGHYTCLPCFFPPRSGLRLTLMRRFSVPVIIVERRRRPGFGKEGGWATRMVSLPSESDLGEYKDSEIQRWLVGMLSARGFQNRVPIDSVLSVTLLVGDSWGLARVMLTIGSFVTQHTTTNKNHAKQLFYRNTESDRTPRSDLGSGWSWVG